ncbi:uncharacterized protein [Malus domestica]|uniref:uncharacterized protein isoform X3 n=1 Tax=Malus domestica TaxID=3750 RepID=UPI003976B273
MIGDQVSKGSDGIMIVEYEQKQGNVVPDGFNSHYLKVYYGKLFPYADIFKWMSYGNDGKHPACDQSYFSRREFSFTQENDVYLRFQSFNSVPELESSVKEKCPVKIDIGPVYSVDLQPAKRHAYAQSGDNVFTPVERELIFDIDMSDYNDVRYCCSGADVCLECWPLMTIAIKVIDTALRDDFGFSHILWVYSGRRGVHCWVCDGKARRRSYTGVLTEFFKKLLLSQKIFSTEERYEKILDMIPDPDQCIRCFFSSPMHLYALSWNLYALSWNDGRVIVLYLSFQLLLLSFMEGGKRRDKPPVQKKTLMLFDGSS